MLLLYYRYIPDASNAIYDILEKISQNKETKRHCYEAEDNELLEKVSSQEITEISLRDRLTQHVEQVIILK